MMSACSGASTRCEIVDPYTESVLLSWPFSPAVAERLQGVLVSESCLSFCAHWQGSATYVLASRSAGVSF